MISVISPPVIEPITLATAKAHLRVDHNADDTVIMDLIVSARQQAEALTGRAFITQTLRLMLDAAPTGGALELPRPPLTSVVHIKTYDDVDVATTLSAANYFVDSVSQPGRVLIRSAGLWPLPARVGNGFEVQYVAGYGPNAADVPHALRQGMLCHLAYLYEHRGEEAMTHLPQAALSLYLPYRIMRRSA
jgi:uncharacterized phiE125 gp8 family phage protein